MSKIRILSFEVAALLASTALVGNPAFAKTAENESKVEEIVVTAQKKSENLQAVPISVTAVTANALKTQVVQRFEDLAALVPGVSMSREGGSTEIYIRGVGTTGGSAGQENAVATFVDGVYMPAQVGATFSFTNIERIEVLKGPQGTLYGRNATGGAVNIITKDPSHTAALEAEIGYGNHNTLQGNLYATAGLSDKVAADVAFTYYNLKDGFGHNVADGRPANTRKDYGFSSKVLIDIDDDTRITLKGDYTQSNGSMGVSYRTYGPDSIQFLTGVRGFQYGWWDISSNIDPIAKVRNWGLMARIEHDFGWSKLTSITGYRRVHAYQDFDLDLGPASIFEAYITEKDKQFSQELQLAAPKDSKLQWIGGLFFLRNPSGFEPFTISGALFAPVGVEIDRVVQTTHSYAAFGQATYPVLPDTNLTVGFRYTIDKRDLVHTGNFLLLDGSTVPDAAPSRYQSTYKSPTWRASLDHKLSDDLMVYGSYSRGFHAGTYTTTAVPTGVPVAPETIDAFEVGEKAMLFDSRLRLNSSVFYYKYKNLQLSKISNGSEVLLNAAKATMYGLDVDFDAVLSDQLSLHGGGEALHGRYDSFPNAPVTTPNPAFPFGDTVGAIDAKGHKLNRTPDWSFNLTLDYHVPLAEGQLSASATYSFNGGFAWEPDNRLVQKAYGIVNGEVRWTSPNESYYIRTFTSNLLNKKYYNQVSTSVTGDTGGVGAGRTFGGAVGFKF